MFLALFFFLPLASKLSAAVSYRGLSFPRESNFRGGALTATWEQLAERRTSAGRRREEPTHRPQSSVGGHDKRPRLWRGRRGGTSLCACVGTDEQLEPPGRLTLLLFLRWTCAVSKENFTLNRTTHVFSDITVVKRDNDWRR